MGRVIGNSTIHYNPIIILFQVLYDFLKYQIKYLKLSLESWDKFKDKIKTYSIAFSKKISREKYINIRKLRYKYSNLVKAEHQQPGKYIEQIDTLRLQIQDISAEHNAGSQIRSKVKSLETDEIPSNYFNKMEKEIAKQSAPA